MQRVAFLAKFQLRYRQARHFSTAEKSTIHAKKSLRMRAADAVRACIWERRMAESGSPIAASPKKWAGVVSAIDEGTR